MVPGCYCTVTCPLQQVRQMESLQVYCYCYCCYLKVMNMSYSQAPLCEKHPAMVDTATVPS